MSLPFVYNLHLPPAAPRCSEENDQSNLAHFLHADS